MRFTDGIPVVVAATVAPPPRPSVVRGNDSSDELL